MSHSSISMRGNPSEDHLLAPGHDRGQKVRGFRRIENQNIPGRRLLKSLQKRVGSFLGHGFSRSDNRHPVPSRNRLVPKATLEFPHLFDLDALAVRLHQLKIREITP